MDLNELFVLINRACLDAGVEPLAFYAAVSMAHYIMFGFLYGFVQIFKGITEIIISIYKKRKKEKIDA